MLQRFLAFPQLLGALGVTHPRFEAAVARTFGKAMGEFCLCPP
jgi:hypothetical protein